jgi:hypothetical protein
MRQRYKSWGSGGGDIGTMGRGSSSEEHRGTIVEGSGSEGDTGTVGKKSSS